MNTALQTVAMLNHGKNNPRNSEGSFVTLRDGRILFAYSHFRGNDGGDQAGCFIAGLISSDDGQSWTPLPKPLAESEGGMNVMSVSLLRLHDGRIAIFYLRKNSLFDCRACMQTSADEGDTWSAPVCCVNVIGWQVTNNDRVIQCADGALIVPAAFHRTLIGPAEKPLGRTPDGQSLDVDYGGMNTFFRSDDAGATWRNAGAWWAAPTGTSQETGILERADGTLFSWCRTNLGHQWGAYSTDGAKTWSVPQPTPFRGPNAPMSIKRIPATGDLLAVWNDHDPRWASVVGERGNEIDSRRPSWGCTPLAVALSRDDGKTWEASRLIETDRDHGYCYIAIHFTKDAVLLAYCCGSKMVLADAKIVRLPLTWLLTGA